MEDFLKFVLVAAVLVVAFIQQTRKEAQKKKKNAPRPPVMPQPEPVSSPLPEGPASEPPTPPRPKTKRNPARTFAKAEPKQNIPVPPPPATEDGTTDYQIHSAEEARRAIIWSEILTRKY